MLLERKPQVTLFFCLFALICIFTVLVFLSPTTEEEQIFSGMTLYNHDYRVRLSPRNITATVERQESPAYSVDLSNVFTPRFSQQLYEDMGVQDELKEAYALLHRSYIKAAMHYISVSSLPDEFHDPFAAFLMAGKAVESSLNASPKNVIALAFSASDYIANPDILMQFSSENLMGLSPNTYSPEDSNGDSGPLAIRYGFLSHPVIPEELGAIGSPSGTRHDKDRPSLVGDRWNLYDSFNCIVGYMRDDLGGRIGQIPDMYKENFYTLFCMFAYWHNAGAGCVYAHSDKELSAEIAHILGGEELIDFARELILEQVNSGNSAKMRGFLYGAGGNEDLIAKPIWEKMYSLASPTLQARIDPKTYKYKSGAGRVNNAGTYAVRALTGWLMIEMTFLGTY